MDLFALICFRLVVLLCLRLFWVWPAVWFCLFSLGVVPGCIVVEGMFNLMLDIILIVVAYEYLYL